MVNPGKYSTRIPLAHPIVQVSVFRCSFDPLHRPFPSVSLFSPFSTPPTLPHSRLRSCGGVNMCHVVDGSSSASRSWHACPRHAFRGHGGQSSSQPCCHRSIASVTMGGSGPRRTGQDSPWTRAAGNIRVSESAPAASEPQFLPAR